VAGRTVGFLFGFLKFGGKPLPDDWQQHVAGHLRIESQLLGVLPEQRGARLGFLLKKRQAEQALRAGIQIINWTVDPLQWPNAVLNFGLLRAMAFDFAPDYYRFRNELNRVPASRFGLTWLVNTQRVTRACGLYLDAAADHPSLIDLAAAPAIQRVNDGAQALVEQPTSQQIAIELPADWTTLQHQDLGYALRWRTTTDRLLQRLIGLAPGQYVVTDVGVESSRRYLVAQRSTTALWAQLGDQSLPPQQIVDKGERSY
ncbi:MAG TPA: hypothetical protein PKE45_25010, partial [Caldilineaceae bacterium]|nr:hypothetical protein [Caldilineaceae bacterium]